MMARGTSILPFPPSWTVADDNSFKTRARQTSWQRQAPPKLLSPRSQINIATGREQESGMWRLPCHVQTSGNMSPAAQEQSILPANHKMHAGQGTAPDTLRGLITFCLITTATNNTLLFLSKINKKQNLSLYEWHQKGTTSIPFVSYSHVGRRKGWGPGCLKNWHWEFPADRRTAFPF